jgi:hypothetical protein
LRHLQEFLAYQDLMAKLLIDRLPDVTQCQE